SRAYQDLLVAERIFLRQRCPQIERRSVGITMGIGERLFGRLDRPRRRAERIFVGRQLDGPLGPAGSQLPRQFLQRLSRLVGRDARDLVAHQLHSSYRGYDPSTFTASQAPRSASTAAATGASSMWPSRSTKNT